MQISKLVLSMAIAATAMTGVSAHAKESLSCKNTKTYDMFDKTADSTKAVGSAAKVAPPVAKKGKK
ncbi:MAG: hypothetical protein H7326_04340 [Bdellovibrionaceae bacterium]|nr:hypothetical protein [Pseudobdellovibrionaceae bacterium]